MFMSMENDTAAELEMSEHVNNYDADKTKS